MDRPDHVGEGLQRDIRLSVVIPCYDSSAFLTETVDSLRDQDLADTEVVFVDDGSRDGTVGQIIAIMESSPPCTMRLIEQPNAGLAGARNTGIAASRGRYVLPLDSDDLIAKGALARFAAALDADPELDVVYGDREDFGDINGIRRSGCFDLSRLRYFNQLPYCAMYRRSLWERVGGYQVNVSGFDDWNFWIAAAAAGACARRLPEVLLHHRRRRTSLMWSLLDRYESIYSQIVINNSACYPQEEVEAATRHLRDSVPSRTASLSRVIFLGSYYKNYEERGG
jgi:glycosyltransferase involved in cell wall biosynthesis